MGFHVAAYAAGDLKKRKEKKAKPHCCCDGLGGAVHLYEIHQSHVMCHVI